MCVPGSRGRPYRSVRAVVVTLAAGALGYVLVALLPTRDVGPPLTVAVVLAGVALLAQLLLDLNRRLDGAAHPGPIADTGRADVPADAEAARQADATPVAPDDLRAALSDLAADAARLDRDTPALLLAFGREELRTVSRTLDAFSRRSDLTCEGEDRHWLLELTRNAGESILATSRTTVDAGGQGFADGGLWLTEYGQRYLAAQRDAVRRGLTVQRVFIMDRPELLDDDNFIEIYRQQTSYGIEVRVIDPSELPGGPENAPGDFIVFDKTISYETTPADGPVSAGPPVIVSTTLISDPTRVTERARYFDKLWAAAR